MVVAPSAFSERLISWNGLAESGFKAWEFLPGMRFAERAAWWRAGVDRAGVHEGLDLCWYRTGDGRLLSLAAGARVPLIYPGAVVAVVDDFLGASVFVAHERRDSREWQLHTIYGHICPRSGVAPGILLDDRDAVGTIADTSGSKRDVPPHLHISLALVAGDGGSASLDWKSLGDPRRALLLDPMQIMAADGYRSWSSRGE